ncbi:MAG TPA: histone deacetylase [Pseudomonadales bacterium]|nr:histone deacetylase [Pseudomonadales bacterium]
MQPLKPSVDLKIVYSPRYNISFFGIEQFHPFDSKKYGRTWNVLLKQFNSHLSKHHLTVDRPVSDEELLLVHSKEYLASLNSPAKLASILELPAVRFLPGWMTAWRVLLPMRWATRGSVIAAKAALQTGAAINLSGGYHHAKPNQGEGFCVFSDAALIVYQLRQEKLLQPDDTIAYVDLDAHHGNGVCHQFLADRRVSIFDMYNENVYPGKEFEHHQRIDWNIPLPFGCPGAEYLAILRENLPRFLDSLDKRRLKLAIYNAGTDVFAGDKLGGLGLSADDVLERDMFVINEFLQRQIPFVMVLAGGYSRQSYQLVANTAAKLLS